MGFIIEDGKGSSRSAGVNSLQKLEVSSVSQSTERFINQSKGEAYNILISATPTGADDCFCYIKNTSEKDLVLEGIGIYLAADEYIDLYMNQDGTPVGGSDITPANLNSSSGSNAEGTFQEGANITGLSGGRQVDRIRHANSNATDYVNFDQDIILKKNGSLALYAQTGTTLIEATMPVYYEEVE